MFDDYALVEVDRRAVRAIMDRASRLTLRGRDVAVTVANA